MQQPEFTLAAWQSAVQDAILSCNSAAESSIARWLRKDGATPNSRIRVYVDAYILRLFEALRANFPALHQLLGDDDFDRMTRRYLTAHPPTHASIRWFGQHLADFLGTETPYANIPSIAELADFEWALRHTIDAADAEVITVEALQAMAPATWATLRFSLHPSLSMRSFQWNTPQIWKALIANEPLPKPVPRAAHWLVYRQPDMVTAWRSATALEIAALNCVDRELCFADLCGELSNLVDDDGAVPLTAATFLKSWVDQGLVSLRPST